MYEGKAKAKHIDQGFLVLECTLRDIQTPDTNELSV